jgi:hypothetical protein
MDAASTGTDGHDALRQWHAQPHGDGNRLHLFNIAQCDITVLQSLLEDRFQALGTRWLTGR